MAKGKVPSNAAVRMKFSDISVRLRAASRLRIPRIRLEQSISSRRYQASRRRRLPN
jgi:hypothetical protein